MTVAGKITVIVSDDPRYESGQTYDVILGTPSTPDPASLLTGTLSDAPREPAPPVEATS